MKIADFGLAKATSLHGVMATQCGSPEYVGECYRDPRLRVPQADFHVVLRLPSRASHAPSLTGTTSSYYYAVLTLLLARAPGSHGVCVVGRTRTLLAAPEVLEGSLYTDKVDMWSLGVVAHIL